MSHKILDSFKKIPYQLQNLTVVQKLQELTAGRSCDSFGHHLTSTYGCLESPSALAYDAKLGLLAVGSKKGVIKVYGTPGVVLTVQDEGSAVFHLRFLPEEGRLLSAFSDGHLKIFELDPKNGDWTERSRVLITHSEGEMITALSLGDGIIYVGTSTGTLFQVAVQSGRLCLGDPTLTSLTSSMVLESIPMDKRSELGVDSSIVALEFQPGGTHLLIAYAGGSVAITVPQAIPQANITESNLNGIASPDTEQPDSPHHQEDVSTEQTHNGAATAPTCPASEPTENDEIVPTAGADAPASRPSKSSIKNHSERRATQKIKEFTRSLRRLEIGKHETVESESTLPVPPAPRVCHVLLRDQPVEWATWRISALDVQSNEITVAYGDGAFQIWPINFNAEMDSAEAIVVPKRDPPSTPYGPLPCGAIKKIIQNPGLNGGLLTAFSGGLPRAEFDDRHAVTLMQDPEHHVCFQFGSKVIDFILIPPQPTFTDDTIATLEQSTNASALLVLTERELVAVDLQQPNWPTFSSPYLNCLDLAPVTTVAHVTKTSSTLLCRLRDAARNGVCQVTSSQWPIWGGSDYSGGVDLGHNDANDLVIVGHANGWVTLWSIGRGDSLHRLGTIHTDALFHLDDSMDAPKCRSPVEVETWPPFRRVGDCALAEAFGGTRADPRLAITQLVVSATSDVITIAIGGAAGQVSLWTCADVIKSTMPNTTSIFEPDVARIKASLINSDLVNNQQYIWKGPSSLRPFEGATRLCSTATPALLPVGLIQLDPPAPVTALALEVAWNVLAVGTAHGFVLVDLLAKSIIHTEFMYCPNTDMTTPKSSFSVNVSSMHTALATRRKQFTAQMRQSFRRLKHGLSQTTPTSAPSAKTTDETVDPAIPQTEEQSQNETAEQHEREGASTKIPSTTTESVTTPDQVGTSTKETETVDPSVGTSDTAGATTEAPTTEVSCDTHHPDPIALTPDDLGSSTVRSLLFAHTYVACATPATSQTPPVPSTRTPSVWVGTTTGRVVVYALAWNDTSGPVTIQLLKELQLQHHAPVLGLWVIDATTRSPIVNTAKIRTGCEVEPSVTEQPSPVVVESTEDANEPKAVADKEPEEPVTVPVNQESHQLLLCSEEQVKLFQLPTLRAVHKHKLIDRMRRTGVTSSHTSHGTTVENDTATGKAKETTATADVIDTGSNDVSNETESKSTAVCTPLNRKCIRACGLQAFHRGTNDTSRLEWNVVVTRQDGKIVILSLPHLRQVFKGPSITIVNQHSVTVCVVASQCDANLVFHHTGGQLIARELTSVPRLTSPVLPPPGAHAMKSQIIIHLPDWARPHAVITTTTTGDEETGALRDETTAKITDVATNGEKDTMETHSTEHVESVAPTYEKYEPTATIHPGDVTIDSVKDYFNGQGTMTIKTLETSSEKHTVVEGGHVVTTLRETECVDGRMTKNDVLKFSTTDDTTTKPITESA